MIQRLEISGVHMELGDDVKRYVVRKIGKLDSYLPRRIRPSIHADVKLKEGKAKTKEIRTCEIVLHLPQETFTVKETTINIYAAIDIAEEKLKQHIKKYKGRHTDGRIYRRLAARWRRSRE
jgi:ribosomal subunit interface protein